MNKFKMNIMLKLGKKYIKIKILLTKESLLK